MPRRAEQHEIDERGQALLRSAIASSIVLYSQSPDYGIDLRAELCGSGQASSDMRGVDAYLQLKSSSHCKKLSDGSKKVVLSSNHLAYYLDSVRRPVFLILADVAEQSCYWVDLQKYEREMLRNVHWRGKRSIGIRMPSNQAITRECAFEQAIKEADETFRVHGLGGVSEIFRTEKAALERRDPRVSVLSMKLGEFGEELVLEQKTDVHFSLRLDGDSDARRRLAEDLLDRGLPVVPTEYGVQLVGSGLPLHPDEDVRITRIQASANIPGSVQFETIDELSKKIGGFEMSGMWSGGRTERRILATTQSTTFGMEIAMSLVGDSRISMQLTVNLDQSRWIGLPVAFLPDMDILSRAFPIEHIPKRFRVDLLCSGNVCLSKELEVEDGSVIARIGMIVRGLLAAREVAREFAGGLRLLRPLSDETIAELEELLALARRQPVKQRNGSACFTSLLPADDVSHRFSEGAVTVGTTRIEQVSFVCMMQDQAIDVGGVVFNIPKAELRVLSIKPTSPDFSPTLNELSRPRVRRIGC